LHFERGRDFARAIEYLTHAGDNATKFYGNAEAADHYTHALSLVDKLPEEETGEARAMLYQKRGAVNFALSRFSQSVDDYIAMLKQEDALTPARKASALSALAMTLFFSHRLEEMEQRADEALAAAKLAGSEELRLDTMMLMGLKHLCYGELETARPILDEVVSSARAINYKPALLAGITWRGCLYFFQSEYEKAIEYEVEAHGLASELREGFLFLTSMFFHGLSMGNLGHMSEALAILEEGISKARRNGDHFWFPRMPNCIGWIHRELQDFKGAFAYDEEGLHVGREFNVLEAEANSLINLGIDHTIAGKPHDAASVFKDTHDIFERDKWFRWRYSIRLEAAKAEHWLRQGDLGKAKEFTEGLFSTASDFKTRKYVAVAHKLRAEIAIAESKPDEARAEYQAALAVLDEFPVPVTRWRVLAGLGKLLSTSGDSEGARKTYNDAKLIVDGIAANVSNDSLRKIFLESEAVQEVIGGARQA
jgi:tetratricopeptide (TPR) repeat protein